MAVDLNSLIPSLQREVAPVGNTEYAALDNSDWLGQLTDAFWEARLDGLLGAWSESGGSVTARSVGGPDIPRDMQQLIVMFAGFRMALTSFKNLNSLVRYKAGPVESEVQKSAQTLKTVLDILKSRIDLIISSLSTDLGITTVSTFDTVVQSNYDMFCRSWDSFPWGPARSDSFFVSG